MSTKFARLELSKKQLCLIETWEWDIIVNYANSYANVLSRRDFWMVWRCHGISCVYFFFLEPKR